MPNLVRPPLRAGPKTNLPLAPAPSEIDIGVELWIDGGTVLVMGPRSEERSTHDWHLREVPEELISRYFAEGWWNDDSMGDLVARGLSAMHDATFAVHSSVRPWNGTVSDVDRAARALAGWLNANNIGSGDIVLFQLPNWVEAAITFWGAAYAGAIVVPVVHFYGEKELEYIVRVTQPALVVTADTFGSADYLSSYADVLGGMPGTWAVVGATAPDDLPSNAVPFQRLLDATPIDKPVAVDPGAPALIAFTSGTTRNPKGVIHSHRTIGFEARQLSDLAPEGGPPSITGAPVGHFIGMLSAFVCSLIKRQEINLIDVWNPAEVLRLMREEGLGVAGGATYFITSLLDHPDFTEEHLKSMPFAGMGGSPVPVAFTERCSNLGIEVYRSYGSTEQPSISGSYIDEPELKRVTTDGHALPGVEIRLDAEGQILSRGPELFLGYTDTALTAEAFDEDGWYLTGDIGVLDSEGYLTIVDRISDVIIRGGENISAQEVEEILLGIDSVTEVAVVAEPDARLGERATAIVRMRGDVTPPTLEQVRQHFAASHLAKQKWPESIRSVSDFPRTPSGKIQKFRLREQLRAGALENESSGG
jgi:acyl-CoA synthetase